MDRGQNLQSNRDIQLPKQDNFIKSVAYYTDTMSLTVFDKV